jgi:hypothetical protein
MINELYLKNEIFSIFENARILFNDFYNGKNNYNEKDIENVKRIITNIKMNIDEIESIID